MMNSVSRCSEKQSWRACLYCIRKPWENQIWKSISSELMEWAVSKNRETCFGRLLINLLRVECWQELVFSRVEIWWIDHTDRFIVDDDDMDSDTVAESDTSLGSRSFLHRVNDQVRKRQNQSSKDATKDSDKHSVIWGMFMSSTLQASVFMGKNYSDNLHSIRNTEDLTVKQMFDIFEKLTSEQSDEIYGVKTIN